MSGCCVGALQDKEVINVCDGSRLGYICDVAVDTCTGRIISITVPGECRLFAPRCGFIVIPWEKIERIGDDTILVSIPPRQNCGGGGGKPGGGKRPWWREWFSS